MGRAGREKIREYIIAACILDHGLVLHRQWINIKLMPQGLSLVIFVSGSPVLVLLILKFHEMTTFSDAEIDRGVIAALVGHPRPRSRRHPQQFPTQTQDKAIYFVNS